jgi:hypothetical protein
MTSAWAQRQVELLSDCVVSPDPFNQLEREGENYIWKRFSYQPMFLC